MPICEKAWLILLITAVVVSMKTIIGDLISGEFLYHKHGYDFCITTLGAVITGLSFEILSGTTLYPGLANVPLGSEFKVIADERHRVIAFLIFMLILSMLGTLVAASASKSIKDKTAKYPDALSILNFVVGTMLLGFNLLLIITKK
jgi:hypothetical protein